MPVKRKLNILQKKETYKQVAVKEEKINETTKKGNNGKRICEFEKESVKKKFKQRTKIVQREENPPKVEDKDVNKTGIVEKINSNLPIQLLFDQSIQSLKNSVTENTFKAISEMGFSTLTNIQVKSIPYLLEGKDLVGYAKTGSGKTLAFLIPAIELVCKLKLTHKDGTSVIIITPTRELAMQTFGVLRELAMYHNYTHGVIMGGTNRKTEAKKLSEGISILIATPGRLLDHIQHTSSFMWQNLQCLIIDEVDRILQIGFEAEMTQILNMLPKKRQTMLFSATQSPKTEMLSKLAFKQEPVIVQIDDTTDEATVAGLQQGYTVCPPEYRLVFLYSFLKKHHKEKKIMIFFSTCNSVEFHYKLFNFIDVPCLRIHGKQKQTKRTKTFFRFSNAKSGALLCTDVAARGLDIPVVDWIIQYDPTDDPKEYIHRVGRTARAGSSGRALLLLMVEELGYLWHLKQAKVPLIEHDVRWDRVSGVQSQLEYLMEKHQTLNKLAKEAYRSFLTAYDAHQLKIVFDVTKLNLTKIAMSFGFSKPPEIDLNISGMKAKKVKKKPTKNGFSDYRNQKLAYKTTSFTRRKN